MREGAEILRVSSKTVHDSGFSVDTDTVQLQLSKAKHACEALDDDRSTASLTASSADKASAKYSDLLCAVKRAICVNGLCFCASMLSLVSVAVCRLALTAGGLDPLLADTLVDTPMLDVPETAAGAGPGSSLSHLLKKSSCDVS
eukprot:COSAG01_NODE_1051_length_11920_cov_153.129600_7_plen_144_part_00